MARTQQAFGRQCRVRAAAFLDRCYQSTLCRHDGAEYVTDHDGADDGAHMQVGTAPAEHFAQAERRCNQQHKQDKTEQRRAFAQGGVAQKVVNEPAGNQRTDTDGHRFGAAHGTARSNQVQRGVEVEHQAEQGDA